MKEVNNPTVPWSGRGSRYTEEEIEAAVTAMREADLVRHVRAASQASEVSQGREAVDVLGESIRTLGAALSWRQRVDAASLPERSLPRSVEFNACFPAGLCASDALGGHPVLWFLLGVFIYTPSYVSSTRGPVYTHLLF